MDAYEYLKGFFFHTEVFEISGCEKFEELWVNFIFESNYSPNQN